MGELVVQLALALAMVLRTANKANLVLRAAMVMLMEF
jgi:hypothetical protein